MLPKDIQGMPVYYIDDNATARAIMLNTLKSLKLEAEVFSSGKNALAMLDRRVQQGMRYPFIITDWKMPDLDGIETARAILASAPNGDQPAIILLTAYTFHEAANAAEDIPFSKILTKPVTPSQLFDAIMHGVGRESDTSGHAARRSWETIPVAASLRGARVLVVEDNNINQELALAFLEIGNIITTVANDGQEALDILAHQTFDGVLMDLQMPVMDGYIATQKIREQPRFKNLPVIAMTANVLVEDIQKAKGAGMIDVIGKPINVQEMYATMAKWIKIQDRPMAPPSAIPRDADENGSLPDLPGIDKAVGLKVCADNVDLLRRILASFGESHNDLSEKFMAARQGADPGAAGRLAHTLKGLAGTIGAHDVAETAAALETACGKNGSPAAIEAALPQVLKAMEPVLAGIAALEAASTKETSSGDKFDPQLVAG